MLDAELILSDAQAITTDAACSNKAYVDTLAPGRAINELWLVVNVETAFASTNSTGTLAVQLQTDDNPSFSSPTNLFTSQIFAVSALTVGKNLVKLRLPEGLERYIRVYYDNATEAFTAGKVDAYLDTGVMLS